MEGGYRQIRSSAWLEHYTDNVGVSSSNLLGSTDTKKLRAGERGEKRRCSSKPSGGLAQLARAPALQAGGHRFDSDILHSPNGRTEGSERRVRTKGVRSRTLARQRIAQRSEAKRASLQAVLLTTDVIRIGPKKLGRWRTDWFESNTLAGSRKGISSLTYWEKKL
jgi:hypothetical protein